MCHTNRIKFTSKIHREIHGKIHGPVNFRIRPQNWAHFWSSFACSGEGHFASDLEALGNNTRPGARFGGHLKITGDTAPHVFHFWRAKIHHHNFVRGGASDDCRSHIWMPSRCVCTQTVLARLVEAVGQQALLQHLLLPRAWAPWCPGMQANHEMEQSASNADTQQTHNLKKKLGRRPSLERQVQETKHLEHASQ